MSQIKGRRLFLAPILQGNARIMASFLLGLHNDLYLLRYLPGRISFGLSEILLRFNKMNDFLKVIPKREINEIVEISLFSAMVPLVAIHLLCLFWVYRRPQKWVPARNIYLAFQCLFLMLLMIPFNATALIAFVLIGLTINLNFQINIVEPKSEDLET